MVILISGISCTGKTWMAQQLMERHRIPYFSIDHLKMGIYKSNPNCGYHPTDSSEHIGAILWPILKNMITTCIENGQHLIIEGCYLMPGMLEDIPESCMEQVTAVFLGFSEKYVRTRFESGILAHRCVIEHRDAEERTMAQFLSEREAFARDCHLHGVDYFEVEDDYETAIKRAHAHVDARIQRTTADS